MSAQTVTLTDTVGIVGILSGLRTFANTVGITDVVTTHRTAIGFDTWRPIVRPDLQLVLVCRTPIGEHDSDTGLTHMALWTFQKDGTREKLEITMGTGIPTTNSWTSFGHPEWSPDGNSVVVAAETSTECQIYRLDSTGYGT